MVCIMCQKEIPMGKGHYDTPQGPVCTDCHGKSNEADTPQAVPS
jgi:hypothetical protein